jgi:hypothetical protein
MKTQKIFILKSYFYKLFKVNVRIEKFNKKVIVPNLIAGTIAITNNEIYIVVQNWLISISIL